MKKVCAMFAVPLVLAHTFFPVLAEEEDPPTEYIKIDIPSYSYSAFVYWLDNGFSRYYVPLDENNEPLFNSSGISAIESVDITSSQANSTYTETNTYNLSGSISENIRGSLYASAVSNPNGSVDYNITTGAGSGVGNLPITGTETVTGTVSSSGTIRNGDITSTGNSSVAGTSESMITYIYNMPWLEGEYIHHSSYTDDTWVQVYGRQHLYIAFYCDRSIWQDGLLGNLCNIYFWSNSNADVVCNSTGYQYKGFYFYLMDFTASNYNSNNRTYFTIDFPKLNSNMKIIPLYMGNGLDLSDDEKTRFQITTNVENTIITENNETQTLMTSGDTISQTSEGHVNTTNNTLTNKVNSLENYESTFNSNLNSSLNNITIPDVGGVAKFGNAARWVSSQFTRIANDQRINFPMIFCLTLGLALTILGRIRT